MTLTGLVDRLVSFYSLLIVVYVILSWFRPRGIVYDVYRILEQLCEPYIGLFRRIVPTAGGLDFSPFVALLVLEYLIRPALSTLVRMIGP